MARTALVFLAIFAIASGAVQAQSGERTSSQAAAFDLATATNTVLEPCIPVFALFFGCLYFPDHDLDMARRLVDLYAEDLGWTPAGPWDAWPGTWPSYTRIFDAPDHGRLGVDLTDFDGRTQGTVQTVEDIQAMQAYCTARPELRECQQ